MRSKKAGLIIAAVLCGIVLAGGIFMLFNKSADKGITDFESINLRLSGMRITEEYEIINKGDKCEIAYYHIVYGKEGDRRELQKSAVCDTSEVIDILNKCSAIKWNGFHGKHPRGVSDGRMFTLKASVNDREKLYADGSENFPRNFNTFEKWLRDKLYNE
ncbi:MAG: hypothetical protein IJT65_04670 [Eubacterium sp.]|nr:hypothetical protein [Eubacterium sp.]